MDPKAKPYSHLEPIVDALIASGNQSMRDEWFYLDRDGWRCDLKEPIDFDLLRAKFDFPKTIILSEPLDKIFCKNSWIEIKGHVSS
jgi:hypothetical protein